MEDISDRSARFHCRIDFTKKDTNVSKKAPLLVSSPLRSFAKSEGIPASAQEAWQGSYMPMQKATEADATF